MSFNPQRQSYGRLPPFDRTEISVPDRSAVDADNALASSEDESDSVKSRPALSNHPSQNPVSLSKVPRRTSFLSELQPEGKRKLSIGPFSGPGSGLQSPTLSADANVNPWGGMGTTLTRVPSNGAWGAVNNSIWKDSPGPIGPPLSQTRSRGDSIGAPLSQVRSGSMSQKDPKDDVIPFSIPLHPTLKTYRSQSYSVGQMEADLARAASTAVKHKPSRLQDVENASALAEVHEGDDEGSDAGVSLNNPHSQSSFSFASPSPPTTTGGVREAGHQGVVGGPAAMQSVSHAATRGLNMNNDLDTLGNFSGANLARPHWQTSLRMDRMDGGSASRRHSLAEVPTRRGSLAADAPPFTQGAIAYGGAAGGAATYEEQAAKLENTMAQSDIHNRTWAQGYFSGSVPALRSQIESTLPDPALPITRTFAGQRQGPFQLSIFNRPSFDTPLYIVAFKCARADIYYVHPETGLEVNEGDLVMVEADRGFDLGTVTHARISWSRAKELKEKSLDEQFRWLMMFSRFNTNLDAPESRTTRGLLATKGPSVRDPTPRKARDGFGMGPGIDPAYTHEIKPRLIKRRAFGHEISNLREKEGNEAKAKRTCQQKAREHGCDMEILDAEFQIDWKKLTFYFYAEDYVNFNSLVTDLYKVYKVRIWMSAINPKTYPSPANRPPSTIGPGAMQGRDTPMDQQVMFNDADPVGALPPSMNPACDTWKQIQQLRGAAMQQGLLPRQGLDPNSTSFTSQFANSVDQQQYQPGSFQPPRLGQNNAWNGNNLGMEPPGNFAPVPGFSSLQSRIQAPTTPNGYRDMQGQNPPVYGGNLNSAMTQSSSATQQFAGLGAPQHFAGLGAPQSFGASNPYTGQLYNSSQGQTSQAWNNQIPGANRPQTHRLGDLSGATIDTEYTRTFGQMSLYEQDDKQ